MTENAIAKEIVDAAFRIHTALGPACWNPFTMQSWRLNWAAADCARHANSQSQ
jgi:hypothetical protein